MKGFGKKINKDSKPTKKSLEKDKLILKALNAHKRGELDVAEEYYSIFLKKGYIDPLVLSNYAIILSRKKDPEEAILLYKKCINSYPNFSNSYINLSNLYLSKKEFYKAEKLCLKAIQINPNQAEAHYNLGIAQKEIGNIKEAIESFEKTIKLSPKMLKAFLNLGALSYSFKSSKEAKQITIKALEIDPACAEAYYNLALIEEAESNLLVAQNSILKAIKINPRYSEAYACASIIFKRMGKLNDSISYQQKSIEISPNVINDYRNLGLVLREKGTINESNKAFKQCIEKCKEKLEYKLIEFQTRTDLAINYLIQDNRKGVKEVIEDIENKKLNEINIKEIVNGLESKRTENKLSVKSKELYCINNQEKNLKTTQAFFNFIRVLNKILEEAKDCEKFIPHIGESHSLSFAHQNIKINNQIKKIKPIFICGAKSYHLGKKENNNFKASIEEQLKVYNNCEEILISFGEIDCRREEGILHYSSKKENQLTTIIKETIEKYVEYLEGILSSKFKERYYFGVPAPIVANREPDSVDKQRKILIKEFNQALKLKVNNKGAKFIDIYKLTVNKNDENNCKYMADNVHLSPECIDQILNKYL